VYGVQLLYAGFAAHRAITLLVKGGPSFFCTSNIWNFQVCTDNRLYVWVYDRQGAIQSEGIGFVESLDYLVILLFSLQRFTSTDWGQLRDFSYNEKLVTDTLLGWSLTLLPSNRENEKTMVLKLPRREIGPTAYGITGRHTRALLVESEGYKNRTIILKLSSVGASRIPGEIQIEKAHKRAPYPAEYLPVVVRSHWFGASRMADLRAALAARTKDTRYSNAQSGCCKLKALVLEKLGPIYKLEGQDLLRAFLD
jgi:hypothetical protein